jgi:hypothetical protein
MTAVSTASRIQQTASRMSTLRGDMDGMNPFAPVPSSAALRLFKLISSKCLTFSPFYFQDNTAQAQQASYKCLLRERVTDIKIGSQ